MTNIDWTCLPWNSLPDGVLELILSKYCKVGFGSQCLIAKKLNTSKVKLFHPILGRPYSMDVSCLIDASIIFSKDGWLRMLRGEDEIFFFDLFSSYKIELPNLPITQYRGNRFKGATFTSNPASGDCMVFYLIAYKSEEHHILTISQGTWKEYSLDLVSPPMYPSYCNPIFRNGKLYYLGRNGELGVFDTKDGGWEIIQASSRIETRKSYESYLIDFNGELMSVFIASMGHHLSVCKWDDLTTSWQRVDDLGEYMLFLSEQTSFASKSYDKNDYMKNKIYFSRFHDKYGVFYCMEDQMYHTFGKNDFANSSLNGTGARLQSCWMEPIKN